jgi:hypothetical protein
VTPPAALIGRAGVAPVHREPSLRSEQVTQLVLGETARLLERQGEWCRARLDDDGYEGWIHAGYLVERDAAGGTLWRNRAGGWSEGAVIELGEGQGRVRLPLRARAELRGAVVGLPDGRAGRLVVGRIAERAATIAATGESPAWRWAITMFAGTPYQWGGVTPWGVDCSGLVQTTFAARGLQLPRDASQQAGLGTAVPPDAVRPDDLLFFTEGSDRITHVAIAGEAGTLVHSTVACGGFVVESWQPGSRAAPLRERLAGVRRHAA